MGVDLFCLGGSFSCNWHAWFKLLELAEIFGWEAPGTVQNSSYHHPLDILEQSVTLHGLKQFRVCGYSSNDGNLVMASDAAALADALEKALAHPDHPEVCKHVDIAGSVEVAHDSTDPDARADRFPEAYVRDFIAFCRRGPFIIL